MAAITTHDLEKQYPNGVKGVARVSIEVADGEFFALLGPSGCGKTTLLRAVAGLEEITGGTLHIGDVDMTKTEPGDRGVAMVFQDYALFPHMDVSDNISYPLKIRKVPKHERRETAKKAANGLSLEGLLDRRPGQLSGGQQQRVALARAIAIQPEVLLLDEPLSNLDARLRLEARTFLKELQKRLCITTIFVTHDQAEALALADRIAVMKDGQLQQVGSPYEVFHAPCNTFVASFIGTHPMNLVQGRIAEGQATLSDGTPIGVSVSIPDCAVTIGIRPEYVLWGEPRVFDISARVIVVESLGVTSLVIARTKTGERIHFIVDEDHIPLAGQQVSLRFNSHKVLFFDAETTERISE